MDRLDGVERRGLRRSERRKIGGEAIVMPEIEAPKKKIARRISQGTILVEVKTEQTKEKEKENDIVMDDIMHVVANDTDRQVIKEPTTSTDPNFGVITGKDDISSYIKMYDMYDHEHRFYLGDDAMPESAVVNANQVVEVGPPVVWSHEANRDDVIEPTFGGGNGQMAANAHMQYRHVENPLCNSSENDAYMMRPSVSRVYGEMPANFICYNQNGAVVDNMYHRVHENFPKWRRGGPYDVRGRFN